VKTDVEVLQDAIKFIEGEGRWCQGAFCRDKDGYKASSSHAYSYCLEGAIREAAGWWTHEIPAVENQVAGLEKFLAIVAGSNVCLSLYNDRETTTQEDAILLLKRGIEHLERNEV
jgi:hypothetical protein